MRRLTLIGVACLCLASCLAFVSRAVAYVVAGFREIRSSAAAFVWSTIEPALRARPVLAYVGPSSSHELRHEAGTSRRAADRHI